MSLFGKNQRDESGRPSNTDSGLGGGARPSNMPRGSARATPDTSIPVATPRTVGEPQRMANIGKSIQIKGDLTGNEDIIIEGTVDGRVDLPNNQLTVGAEGKVKAEINAKTVVVIGHVTGNVTAVERVEVQASGIIDGDVKAPRLIVAEGAVLNGAVNMGNSAGAAGSNPSPALNKPPAAAGEAA